MEPDKRKKEGIIGSIIIGCWFLGWAYGFVKTSKTEIAGNGSFIFSIAFWVGVYFIIKLYLNHTGADFNNIIRRIVVRFVVPIGIFIASMFLYGLLLESFNTMYIIGVITFIAFFILLGIYIFKERHED